MIRTYTNNYSGLNNVSVATLESACAKSQMIAAAMNHFTSLFKLGSYLDVLLTVSHTHKRQTKNDSMLVHVLVSFCI